MKKTLLTIIILFLFSMSFWTNAQQWSRWRQGREPMEIFENVSSATNKDLQVQENQLNKVSNTEWTYASQYKISNTLSSISNHISPYLDWIVYIGTALAIILVIYNWLMLVLWQFSTEDHNKTLGKLKQIAIWILILRGFRWILKIMMIVINAIAWK